MVYLFILLYHFFSHMTPEDKISLLSEQPESVFADSL